MQRRLAQAAFRYKNRKEKLVFYSITLHADKLE